MIEQRVGGEASIVQETTRSEVDFIVIGAMRAGTTLLNDVLTGHPDISLAKMKETDFFIVEKNYPRGIEWFRKQFDADRRLRGEISPNYSKSPNFGGVPQRIHRHCPHVRLIYILRDPIARAVSEYGHSWNMGELTETPQQILDQHEYFSILGGSSYARQLREYLKFFPAEQILVLDFESFIADPQPQLDRLLQHIGAAPMELPPMLRQNGNDELSRIPKPLLRLTQGPLRPLLTTLIGPRVRGRLRKLLARGPQRHPPAFPPEILARMKQDLAADMADLRGLTGQEFPRWSI